MAENSNSATNNALYFIVGGLVVVAGFAFMYFGGYVGDRTHKAEITIEIPKAP